MADNPIQCAFRLRTGSLTALPADLSAIDDPAIGIGIAAAYLPLYLLVSGVAYGYGKRLRSEYTANWKFALLGIPASTLFTFLCAALGIAILGSGFKSFVAGAAASLFAPLFLAVILDFLGRRMKGEASVATRSVALGAVFTTPFMLAIIFQTAEVVKLYDRKVTSWAHADLCTDAEIRYLIDVPPAESVFVPKDEFMYFDSMYSTRPNTVSYSLVDVTSLRFVERPVHPRSDFHGKFKFERVESAGKDLQRETPATKKAPRFQVNGIGTPVGQYLAISTVLERPDPKHDKIGGARIEILAARDRKLIAVAQYYWDDKSHVACPKAAQSEDFPYRFIASALNAIDPASRIPESRGN